MSEAKWNYCFLIANLNSCRTSSPLVKPPIETSTITSTVDTHLALLSGVWSGEFRTDDSGPWDILLTMNGNCHLNEICGTVQYDQSSCNASVTFISVENNRYEFIAGKVGTGPECLPVDYQYLERVDNDTMNYFVGWGDVKGSGVLNKIR